MIEALQTAIDTGMEMMDKYYEKVTYELSDSEDDGDDVHQRFDTFYSAHFYWVPNVFITFSRPINSVIFQAKDLYAHRKLPYLIGSKEWHEKWHIGLNDEESEESDNENVEEEDDEDTLSSSPSPAVSLSSNVPVSMSESENPTGVIISPRKSGWSRNVNLFSEIKIITKCNLQLSPQLSKIYLKVHQMRANQKYRMQQ